MLKINSYFFCTVGMLVIFIFSGCGEKKLEQINQGDEQVNGVIEELQNQNEEQQKKIDELQNELINQDKLENEAKQQEKLQKESKDREQAAIVNEIECRKLYSANPECTISNKIYRTKAAFDKFIDNEKENHDASKSTVEGYKKTFNLCQDIIVKCG